jgi:hypothetical protein
MEAIIEKGKRIDWTLCKDGTKHEGAVIAAVNYYYYHYFVSIFNKIYIFRLRIL